MQRNRKQDAFLFQDLGKRKIVADFSGGHLSSDGGAVLLREIEERHGLIQRLARCFQDFRKQEFVEHSIPSLLAQRINGLALGYEDLNDDDQLRRDPIHALAAGKEDILGETRFEANDRGKALAGSSTLNRMELAAEKPDSRYKKIVVSPEEVEELLMKEGVRRIPKHSKDIVIDFDATDDPLHGKQEGAYFHGYYKHYCYLPLYAFCGNIPLLAQLRDCKRDASLGTVEALEKLVPIIRERFGKKVNIINFDSTSFLY